MIVDAGGADVGVAEPFLDLGDVGAGVKGIGRGGGDGSEQRHEVTAEGCRCVDEG